MTIRSPHFHLRTLLALLFLSVLGCTPHKSTHAAPAATAVSISAASGQYRLDPAHALLQFSVLHLGLSNYVAGFTAYSVDLQLDSNNIAASSVAVTVDPNSIRTDFRGDYKATHPDSTFSSWEQDLAMSDKFFNAATYPEIRFQSTSVEEPRPGELQIRGDLTLLGQTHPLTLRGEVVGSVARHPFTKQGALGLRMSGTFKRSTFGMDYLLKPPLIGDDVTIAFEGELHQI